jgi:hypothetical protein
MLRQLDCIAAPSANAAPARSFYADRLALIGLLLLIGLQFLLFNAFARREITWAYPRYHDQLHYLFRSYATYEAFKDKGIWPTIWNHLFQHGAAEAIPNGATQDLQAALLYRVAGPSRLTALSMNSIYWAGLQLAVFATVRWKTRSLHVAWAAVSLLLLATAPFQLPGGMFDFRLDFAAMCMFGILICALMRSELLRSRRWSAIAGLIAAWLIAYRFVAIGYVAAACVGVLAARARFARPTVQSILNACIVLALPALTIALIVWPRHHAIGQYYVGHIAGDEQSLRLARANLTGVINRLKFYPQSVVLDHLGVAFGVVAGGLLLFACTIRSAAESIRRQMIFLIVTIVVITVILTVDPARSRVVGMILVPPMLFAVVLPLQRMFAKAFRGRTVLAILVVVLAIGFQIVQLLFCIPMSKHRQDFQSVAELYATIDAVCIERGWRSPQIASDHIVDYLAVANLGVFTYEHDQRPTWAHETLAQLSDLPDDEYFAKVRCSDIVLITQGPPVADTDYPFNRQSERLHAILQAWCDQHLQLARRLRVMDRDVWVYARRNNRGRAVPSSQSSAASAYSPAGPSDGKSEWDHSKKPAFSLASRPYSAF